MTEVFSAIFGRKKSKAPLPPSPNVNESDGFEVIGQEEFAAVPNNNNERPPLVLENHEYETLFSFLQVQNGNSADPSSSNSPNGGLRPVRRAPPVPNMAAGLPYPLQPSAVNGYRAANDPGDTSNSSGLYLSGVPFQLSAGLGGDHYSRHELTQIGAGPRPIDMNEFNYSFSLERQTLDESSPSGDGQVQLPPMPAPRRRF